MALSKGDLMRAIDRQNGRDRLDRVRVITPDRTYNGTGILECKDTFSISITLPKGHHAPSPSPGIVSRKHFWKLKGVLEGSLHISIQNLAPFYERDISNGIHTLSFNANELDIAPSSFDRKTSSQILKMPSKNQGKPRGPRAKPGAKIKNGNPEVSFFAVLRAYKLIAHNKGTDIVETNAFLGEKSNSRQDTYMGELPDWRYGLIQIKDDVHVHLRSQKTFRSKARWKIKDISNHF
jgi:hypothetical protein